ncbi:MAG: peptidyl-prolyl cis-trans isomerase [Gammaproteobacteria bacterium]|jgi:peptidyl-prolyl cis-trans isomerase B (cyclophilin B)|nr:peptidyl-prolyl cis-trans isomerase [Gammaproteobacteria bacterium]
MNVRITTTHGDITLELNPEKAPITVENFISYAKSGHYDGTIFHRVIEDFMVQGGGLDQDMKDKATNASIQNEADNGLSNLDGTVAMARTADPHSASAQFFINTTDNAFLDFRSASEDGWGYCVFGKVVGGDDVVVKIEESATTSRNGYQDVPEELIVIEKVEVLES